MNDTEPTSHAVEVVLPAVFNPHLGLPPGMPCTVPAVCTWCSGTLADGFVWSLLDGPIPVWSNGTRQLTYPPLATCTACELYVSERRWDELLDLVVPEGERDARMVVWRALVAHLTPDTIAGRVVPGGTLLLSVRRV